MRTKDQFVTNVIDPITSAATFSALSIKNTWKTIIPKPTSRNRLECQYCCERKRPHDFLTRGAVPYTCQDHVTGSQRVCKTCMESAIAAQLDCKPLLRIGCPTCNDPWDPENLKLLVGVKNQRRFKKLEQLAREQVLAPEDVPDGATMEDLLVRGARFWFVLLWLTRGFEKGANLFVLEVHGVGGRSSKRAGVSRCYVSSPDDSQMLIILLMSRDRWKMWQMLQH